MIKSKPATVSADRLKSFIDRYEKLGEERDAVSGDMRDILTEAKSAGYDAPTIRWLVKERKVDVAERDERDQLRDVYAHALGMAVSLVEVGGLSLRKAAKATGLSKSSIHRALSVPKPSQPAGSETGEIKSAGPDTPLREGAGTTDKPDGPGSVLATPPKKYTAGPEQGAVSSSLPPDDASQAVRIEEPAATPMLAAGASAGTSTEQEALAARSDVKIADLCSQMARKPNETAAAVVTSDEDRCLSGRVSRSDEKETDDVHVQHGLRLGIEVARADMESPHVRGLQAPHRHAEGGRQEGQPAGLRSEQGRVSGEDREALGRDREEGRHEEDQEAHASEEQAPPTPPLGAVAEPSSAERVASPNPDGLDLPPRLLAKRREIEERRRAT